MFLDIFQESKKPWQMVLEKWGDVKLLEVQEVQTLPPEQTRISGA